jgi:membrane-bound serine protease (ClpP class)
MGDSTNFAVLLLLIGIAGILIEVSHPGISIPGVVGAVAFGLGILYLVGVPLPEVDIGWPVVLAAGVVLGGASVVAVRAGLRVRGLPVHSGAKRMVGATGVVTSALAPSGQVRVQGETWSAVVLGHEPEAIEVGEKVFIVAVRGLTLEVVPESEVV